jgi:formate dehydrogenase assembly factor FdhD
MSKDEPLEWVEYIKANGDSALSREGVVQEVCLSIRIDNRPFAAAMITPLMEREFVVGHLFGQRVIRSTEDIRSLKIENNVAKVSLEETDNKEKEDTKVISELKIARYDILSGVKAT